MGNSLSSPLSGELASCSSCLRKKSKAMYSTSFVLLSAQAPACAFSVGIFVPHNRLLLSFVGSDGRSIWWSFGRTMGVVGLLQQDLNLSKWVVLSEFNEWNGTMLNYRSNEVIIAKCNRICHREKAQGKWNGNQWIGILPWLSGQDDHYSHLSCRQWMSESLFNERSEVEVIIILYVWAVQTIGLSKFGTYSPR